MKMIVDIPMENYELRQILFGEREKYKEIPRNFSNKENYKVK